MLGVRGAEFPAHSTKSIPQISTTEGENDRKELAFAECLLSCVPGLCWHPTNITPLEVPSPTQQVLLLPLFHREEHQVQETPACISAFLALISLLPAYLVQQPSGA